MRIVKGHQSNIIAPNANLIAPHQHIVFDDAPQWIHYVTKIVISILLKDRNYKQLSAMRIAKFIKMYITFNNLKSIYIVSVPVKYNVDFPVKYTVDLNHSR